MPNIITTAVGTGEKGFAGDGGPAEKALLNGPFDLCFDAAGNLYFSDTFNNLIRRVDGRGIVTTVAGNGEAAYSGDGGPAHRAGLAEPNGLAFSPDEKLLYITDVADNRVRVVNLAASRITTFAGTGAAEHSGDGGPAAKAATFGARAVKVAADGTVYILERQGSSLRAVDPKTGIISTIAGTTARGYAGDGGPALSAVFDAPKEMAIDRDGALLIVDTENHAIRRIDPRSRIVTNLAGGRQGPGGDGGPAEAAGLDRPHGAVVGPDGAVYIGDTNNHRIRKVVR